MLNINFVPDDYIQNNESRRTNLMYLVLFVVLMAALGSSFMVIKIRQKALDAKEQLVNTKISQAQKAIKQFEELQTRRKAMMKTALTTAELLEPVPRSVLLASLTNTLPKGVSLLRLKLVQKEPKKSRRSAPAATTKYKAAKDKKKTTGDTKVSKEKLLQTHIDIKGIASNDRQVADYIGQLSNSILLSDVALVESKEHEVNNMRFRRFKLTAMLKKDPHFTSEDIKNAVASGEQ